MNSTTQLFASALLSGLTLQGICAQSYDPTGLLNDDALHQGDITIDSSGKHGVALDTNAADGTETILQGNIAISTDRDKLDTPTFDVNAVNGILFSNKTGSQIRLETQSEGDRISIDVYNHGGAAIRTNGPTTDAGVVIDGSRSTQPIKLTLHNTSNAYVDSSDYFGAVTTRGAGVHFKGADVEISTRAGYANGMFLTMNNLPKINGPVVVDQNLFVTTEGDQARGIYCNYMASTSEYEALTVHGDTTIRTKGHSADGILSGGVSTFHGNLDIRTEGNIANAIWSYGDVIVRGNFNAVTTGNQGVGIFTSIGTSSTDANPFRTTVHGTTTITTSGERAHGVQAFLRIDGSAEKTGATEAVIQLLGDTRITTTGASAHGMYTTSKSSRILFANATINVDSTKGSLALWAYSGAISGNGLMNITGNIAASSALLELHMTGNSLLNGKSSYSGQGAELKLTLSDASRWIVTANSSVSELTLNSGSSLVMGIRELTDFTTITGAAMALAQGSVISIDVDSAFTVSEGDSFRIFISNSIDDDGVVVRGGLESGLIWDTSRLASDGVITAIARQAIPEPTGAAFALLGLAGLTARRRR